MSCNNRNLCVVGFQWGDEGKGKVVDFLTERFDVVARYQGGGNAGHTVVIDDHKYVLHLIPSGILHSGKDCVVGNGVVVDPEQLVREVDELREQGIEVGGNLLVSDRAHVVFPYHKLLDSLDTRRDDGVRIGTTGRGIGPCYADKMYRTGIRVGELYDDGFADRLRANVEEKNRILALYDVEPLDWGRVRDAYRGYADRIKPFVTDTTAFLYEAAASGKRILFEGAQGVMLDVDFGTYPFISSSNASPAGAAAGTGLPPKMVGTVMGIVKAYCTRVGEGPFPTEIEGPEGERLRERGGEYGATTGRPRRCGWFDAVAVRHAIRVSGADALAVTKLDVLSGLDEVALATDYMYNGRRRATMPASADEIAACRPVYEKLPGWKAELDGCESVDELPAEARAFVGRLEELLDTPVEIVSIGKDRRQLIDLRQ